MKLNLGRQLLALVLGASFLSCGAEPKPDLEASGSQEQAVTSSLSFTHNPSPPYLSPDVVATLNSAGTGYNITVTLQSSNADYCQLIMWWGELSGTPPVNFVPANAHQLLPDTTVGNVGPLDLVPQINVTQWLLASPSTPAVFTLGWTIPATEHGKNIGFFFQATDFNTPARSWQPGNATHAQQNVLTP